MDKTQILAHGEKAIQEMTQAKEKYCKLKKRTPFAEDLFDIILFSGEDLECCCFGIIFVFIAAIPSLIFWQFEKMYLDKKFNKVILQAKHECNTYLEKINEYRKIHPNIELTTNACTAFMENKYIGTLSKKKAFFGLLQKDEDWRLYSIEMAIQEIQTHMQVISEK